jgi:hypothetical protein
MLVFLSVLFLLVSEELLLLSATAVSKYTLLENIYYLRIHTIHQYFLYFVLLQQIIVQLTGTHDSE